LAFKTRRVDDALPLRRRHGAEIADRGIHHSLAVRWQLLDLPEYLLRLLFLFGSQVFPGVHPVQDLQLFLRRQVREMLQSFPHLLLLLGRQTAKCRIALQGALLLGWRHIFVLSQPVSRVALRPGRRTRGLRTCLLPLRRPLCRMISRSRMISGMALRAASLREARHRSGHRQHRYRACQPARHEISPHPCPVHTPRLRIRHHILLQIQIVEQFKIRIHIVVIV
jgi:hypothetical protein